MRVSRQQPIEPALRRQWQRVFVVSKKAGRKSERVLRKKVKQRHANDAALHQEARGKDRSSCKTAQEKPGIIMTMTVGEQREAAKKEKEKERKEASGSRSKGKGSEGRGQRVKDNREGRKEGREWEQKRPQQHHPRFGMRKKSRGSEEREREEGESGRERRAAASRQDCARRVVCARERERERERERLSVQTRG